jgi:hypothetical protein
MDSRNTAGKKKATILIVEDETIVAFDLKNTLEKLGYLAPGSSPLGWTLSAPHVSFLPT